MSDLFKVNKLSLNLGKRDYCGQSNIFGRHFIRTIDTCCPDFILRKGKEVIEHCIHIAEIYYFVHYLAPRRGLRGIVFTRSICVCVCVCLSVCVSVCPADILVSYFSVIRRDIDLKFIQDTYRVVLNSKVKVTGTVQCLLKVQSYNKNCAIEFFL